jgi:hypothetical protein
VAAVFLHDISFPLCLFPQHSNNDFSLILFVDTPKQKSKASKFQTQSNINRGIRNLPFIHTWLLSSLNYNYFCQICFHQKHRYMPNVYVCLISRTESVLRTFTIRGSMFTTKGNWTVSLDWTPIAGGGSVSYVKTARRFDSAPIFLFLLTPSSIRTKAHLNCTLVWACYSICFNISVWEFIPSANGNGYQKMYVVLFQKARVYAMAVCMWSTSTTVTFCWKSKSNRQYYHSLYRCVLCAALASQEMREKQVVPLICCPVWKLI